VAVKRRKSRIRHCRSKWFLEINRERYGLMRRCRGRQILGVQRIFGRISPNLPKQILGPLFLRTFSQANVLLGSHPRKKRSSCGSANVARHFSQTTLGAIFAQIFSGILRRFSKILPRFPWFRPNFHGFCQDFHQIKTFGGALAPP